ncbi:F-box protein At3g07870-like [Lycium barbarum]|uniref:F-box protein At3g07870-like n=1 Tax=Lycium barbarum TaxID=112863 RepID=UPI00293F36F6|nr:F-box protein At3g07870-like [Lycium barbarum]
MSEFDFEVVGSCQGLLCISDYPFSDSLYVYNPFTKDYKELPISIEFEVQNLVFGFGFHPVTKEYKVIKIINYNVEVFSVGSNRWRSIGEVVYHFDPISQGIMLNGKMHWVTRSGNYYGPVMWQALLRKEDMRDLVELKNSFKQRSSRLDSNGTQGSAEPNRRLCALVHLTLGGFFFILKFL